MYLILLLVAFSALILSIGIAKASRQTGYHAWTEYDPEVGEIDDETFWATTASPGLADRLQRNSRVRQRRAGELHVVPLTLVR